MTQNDIAGPLGDRIAEGTAKLRELGAGTPDAALAKMARSAVLRAEHARLRDALSQAGQRAARADRARRAALTQTAAVIREGRALRDAYGDDMPRLELTDAMELTGLSRPTLYAQLDREAPEGPAGWDDRRLARGLLDGTADDTARAEFRVRFPEVDALRDAAEVLLRAAPRGAAKDWLKAPPAAAVLNAAWRDQVQAIADGREGAR
jgi:hypothetical protein